MVAEIPLAMNQVWAELCQARSGHALLIPSELVAACSGSAVTGSYQNAESVVTAGAGVMGSSRERAHSGIQSSWRVHVSEFALQTIPDRALSR